MVNKDAEFLKKLLATFRIEADEHLKGISSGLFELEKCKDPEREGQLVETIFREAHSLKGAARAVNLTGIESLCQPLESVFSSLKKKETRLGPELFNLLQEALDLLDRLLKTTGERQSPDDKALHEEMVRRLKTAPAGGRGQSRETRPPVETPAVETGETNWCEVPPSRSPEAEEEPPPPAQPPRTPPPQSPVIAETVRVSTAKLSSMLLKSEEMLSAKLAAWQRALDIRSANEAFGVWKKEWARIRPLAQELRSAAKQGDGRINGDGETLRLLGRVLDFMEWSGIFVKALEERYAAEARSIERDGRALGGMVNSLLEDMKKVLMFPFSSLLEILPKLVRDLSRDSGKEVDLVLRGEEIEIDRRILEEMKDPLGHLIRNCIDHGIETPAERRRKNKPERGTVTVSVAPRDDKVELIVADDGAGISLAEVRASLVKLGLFSGEKAEELSDRELLPYVFQSGVSTTRIITELSGRGLGLAIVREKVEKLGGTVTLETSPDAGTTFGIVLPLTVATFRGILVRAGGRDFVLPTMHVKRAVRLNKSEIKTVENRETILVDNEPLSLARLTAVLGLPPGKTADSSEMAPAVVLTGSGAQIAFLVDEIRSEQEVLLKGLGRQLSRVRNVAGATILGSGRVVPILNVPDLLKSAVRVAAPAAVEAGGGEAERKRSIMVVEDSITTRTLLQNILEVAGFEVVTAVDGVDALTKLRTFDFDIVVSDVDMPRMNGFELTSKIRGDKKLGDLPVVLVTALSSREDRERGIDVGANAYIVKSSFDQGNLLEVINRLV